MHRQFARLNKEIRGIEHWLWLKEGSIKYKRELNYGCSGRSTVLTTNLMKAKTYTTQEESISQICKQVDESITLLESECPKLARREYTRARTTGLQYNSLGSLKEQEINSQLRLA